VDVQLLVREPRRGCHSLFRASSRVAENVECWFGFGSSKCAGIYKSIIVMSDPCPSPCIHESGAGGGAMEKSWRWGNGKELAAGQWKRAGGGAM
jgi:hypothetical protein